MQCTITPSTTQATHNVARAKRSRHISVSDDSDSDDTAKRLESTSDVFTPHKTPQEHRRTARKGKESTITIRVCGRDAHQADNVADKGRILVYDEKEKKEVPCEIICSCKPSEPTVAMLIESFWVRDSTYSGTKLHSLERKILGCILQMYPQRMIGFSSMVKYSNSSSIDGTRGKHVMRALGLEPVNATIDEVYIRFEGAETGTMIYFYINLTV